VCLPSKVYRRLFRGVQLATLFVASWCAEARQRCTRRARPAQFASTSTHMSHMHRIIQYTYVGAGEVVDGGLGQHGVVLELRLAERRGVASNDDELGLAGSQGLEGRLVAERHLTRLHDQGQTGVDAVGILLALLGGHCVGMW